MKTQKLTHQQPVAEEIFNHAQAVLVFHGLDTIATITLNNHKLLPNPNNMFVRYQYDVRNKLITVFISIEIFMCVPHFQYTIQVFFLTISEQLFIFCSL